MIVRRMSSALLDMLAGICHLAGPAPRPAAPAVRYAAPAPGTQCRTWRSPRRACLNRQKAGDAALLSGGGNTMTNGKEYLLGLDSSASSEAKEGSNATIYDWSGGDSFTVIAVLFTQSDWAKSAHVRATRTNSYSNANCEGSRLRYQLNNGELESRAIVSVAEL
jgi:hypothetical protein